MFFSHEMIGDIFYCKLLIARATLKEAIEFKEMLFTILHKGSRNVVIDFSECEYIDSTFIGAVVFATRKYSSVFGEIKLVNLKNNQNEIFNWSRVNKIFDIYNSAEDAINSFTKVYSEAV